MDTASSSYISIQHSKAPAFTRKAIMVETHIRAKMQIQKLHEYIRTSDSITYQV